MKYLALLSGGKDSCYNLVHCAQNGHELVAAASLGPELGKEEIDSYLYQTVGQDAIELVARALDVPLYRRVISGIAIEQGSEYGGRNPNNNIGGVAGDETEDLYELLSEVKCSYPDIQGVSVGAILSNYQRVRVEHVCRRLNLTTLCYLWQRNQEELLSEMIDAGMEAVLIKVAGIGLMTEHLGRTLAQMQPTLLKLNTLYGSHICGEGGEYETLTLDCPLFKQRITLVETETVIHSDNDFATVAFLRVKNALLAPKSVGIQTVHIPPLLEGNFERVRSAIDGIRICVPESTHEVSSYKQDFSELRHPFLTCPISVCKNSWITVSNVQANLLESESSITLEEEVIRCFNTIIDHLARYGLQLSQASFINILISSMDLFGPVNTIYSTFFGISPPGRACVGVDLPKGTRVKMECIAYNEKAPTDRQALHVQGLSYWAPANIGPYSQAIIAGERVFISGQIGLIPSKLALPSPRALAIEMALACQHVDRITSALKENSGGGWKGHTQLSIYWTTNLTDLSSVKIGHQKLLPESVQYPTLFVAVKELPKDALVEKQVVLHTGRCAIIDEDDGEIAMQNCQPTYETRQLRIENDCVATWEYSIFKEDGAACSIIFLREFQYSDSNLRRITSDLTDIINTASSIRYFYLPHSNISEDITRSLFGQVNLPLIHIPCRAISNLERDDWSAALCVLTASK